MPTQRITQRFELWDGHTRKFINLAENRRKLRFSEEFGEPVVPIPPDGFVQSAKLRTHRYSAWSRRMFSNTSEVLDERSNR